MLCNFAMGLRVGFSFTYSMVDLFHVACVLMKMLLLIYVVMLCNCVLKALHQLVYCIIYFVFASEIFRSFVLIKQDWGTPLNVYSLPDIWIL